jgi:hypothetical protein
VKNEPQIGSSLWQKARFSRSPAKIEKRLELSRLESMTRPATSFEAAHKKKKEIDHHCSRQACQMSAAHTLTRYSFTFQRPFNKAQHRKKSHQLCYQPLLFAGFNIVAFNLTMQGRGWSGAAALCSLACLGGGWNVRPRSSKGLCEVAIKRWQVEGIREERGEEWAYSSSSHQGSRQHATVLRFRANLSGSWAPSLFYRTDVVARIIGGIYSCVVLCWMGVERWWNI